MADEKKRGSEIESLEDNKTADKKKDDFTQMPDAEPYPDMEPEQSAEKQVEQFNKTANTGKDSSDEK